MGLGAGVGAAQLPLGSRGCASATLGPHPPLMNFNDKKYELRQEISLIRENSLKKYETKIKKTICGNNYSKINEVP
jgi:hypothetical protein